MRVSVIGATSYAGVELVRLLTGHPYVSINILTTESYKGESMTAVYPHLAPHVDKVLQAADPEAIAAHSDVVFVALPHGHAMQVVPGLQAAGVRVIDFGADYRFREPDTYEQWYKVSHTHRDARAVYGLPEWRREEIKGATLVANPGCYPTAAILGAAPLLNAGLVEPDPIIIDAKSGISGAGRTLGLSYHFAEASENVRAYNIGAHRHTPEIEQELGRAAGQPVYISFTPHLIPMSRGILTTLYLQLKPGVDTDAVTTAYRDCYRDEPFVRLLGPGGYPATKHVRGSNYCDIGWHLDKRTGRVVVVAAIDNLVKGAAGQAVQNLNLMAGFPETTGLTAPPLFP